MMYEVRVRSVTGEDDLTDDETAVRVSPADLTGGDTPRRAVAVFEAAVRSQAASFRCYRAWEMSSVWVGAPPQRLTFAEFGRWLLEPRGEVSSDVRIYMREPVGYDELFRRLSTVSVLPDISAHREAAAAPGNAPGPVCVTVVVPSSMVAAPVQLDAPVTYGSLMDKTRSALDGALADAPFELLWGGEPLTEESDFGGVVSGAVLFYRPADRSPTEIGVRGWYKCFYNLATNDHLSNQARMDGIKSRILRGFGVGDAETRAGGCSLLSAVSHAAISTVAELEPRMDIVVPDSILVHVSVYKLPTDSVGASLTRTSTPNSPLAGQLQPAAAPNGDSEAVLLMKDWSWQECLRAIGKQLFDANDEVCDVLDGVDVVESVRDVADGAYLVARPLNRFSEYRCFSYGVENQLFKAGEVIPVSSFPLGTQTWFDQVRALWSVPEDCKFRLYAHSQKGRTEVQNNFRINAPRKGRAVKVTLEPIDFIIVRMSIDSTSYVMLDDLLTGVPRSCSSVCLSHNALSDAILCTRDISNAFNLPSSVAIAGIMEVGGDLMPIAPSVGDITSNELNTLHFEPFKEYVVLLRQRAPVELTTLSIQTGVSEVTLQQLWNEHCSLEEIAWVLMDMASNSRSRVTNELTVDTAKMKIFDRRQRRIPNDILFCVEAVSGQPFSISPEDVISYLQSITGVAVLRTANGCDTGASRWFFDCQNHDMAAMIYNFPPVEITSADGRTEDTVIFLAPNPDDAIYDSRMRNEDGNLSILNRSASADISASASSSISETSNAIVRL